MAFQSSNINQIVEEIKSSGLAYSNRYEVTINTPAIMQISNLSIMRSISLRCDSVTIPGRSFSTTPFRYYGPARNMPYEQIYSGEVGLTFILSEDLRERDFFESWMAGISNLTDYKMEFYNNYTSTMEIDVINKDQDAPLYKFTVDEIYPKALGDIQVGYDKDNDFMRQDVTMSYRKYSVTAIPRKYPPRPPANATNLLFGQRQQPNLPSNDSRSSAVPWYDTVFQKKPGGGVNRANPSEGTINGIIQ